MENEKKEAKAKEVTKPQEFKVIRNRSGQKIELFICGKAVVLLAGESAKVPIDFPVPQGVGLFVR